MAAKQGCGIASEIMFILSHMSVQQLSANTHPKTQYYSLWKMVKASVQRVDGAILGK